jgi:hypothetical protein
MGEGVQELQEFRSYRKRGESDGVSGSGSEEGEKRKRRFYTRIEFQP